MCRADRRGEGAGTEKPEPQERPARALGMYAIAEQERERHDEQPENLRRGEPVLAEDFEHVGEEREARARAEELLSGMGRPR